MAGNASKLKFVADVHRLLSRRVMVIGVGILVWVLVAALVTALPGDPPQWAETLTYFGLAFVIGIPLFLGSYLRVVAEGIARKHLRAAEPYYQNADSFRELGQFSLAVTEYDIVVNIDPDNARAYMGRGNIYELQGAHDLAIADFTTAIKMDSFIRGLAHRKSMADDASDYDLAWAYYYRGCSYRSKGNSELEKSDFEAAISVGSTGFPKILAENELRIVHQDNDGAEV